MSVTPRVSTPVSVGRFVASIRSVAASSDGLVVCSECRRHMSDMAETCPHCNAAVTGRVVVTPAASTDDVDASGVTRFAARDLFSVTLMVLALALASYFISLIARS
jgi:hypothetical protein